jgi:hypothetical protein
MGFISYEKPKATYLKNSLSDNEWLYLCITLDKCCQSVCHINVLLLYFLLNPMALIGLLKAARVCSSMYSHGKN